MAVVGSNWSNRATLSSLSHLWIRSDYLYLIPPEWSALLFSLAALFNFLLVHPAQMTSLSCSQLLVVVSGQRASINHIMEHLLAILVTKFFCDFFCILCGIFDTPLFPLKMKNETSSWHMFL
jgi:hypothetical protein